MIIFTWQRRKHCKCEGCRNQIGTTGEINIVVLWLSLLFLAKFFLLSFSLSLSLALLVTEILINASIGTLSKSGSCSLNAIRTETRWLPDSLLFNANDVYTKANEDVNGRCDIQSKYSFYSFASIVPWVHRIEISMICHELSFLLSIFLYFVRKQKKTIKKFVEWNEVSKRVT